MPSDLVFMMGNYEAHIPGDRVYSQNHLWLQPHQDGYQVGFSAYSVRLLQDVYFLDWTIDPETDVRHKQAIGEIESSKALSTIYPPQQGRVLEFNELLLDDPSAINADGYGKGWLYTFSTTQEFLTSEEYIEHLGQNWEEAQRMIKGQINE